MSTLGGNMPTTRKPRRLSIFGGLIAVVSVIAFLGGALLAGAGIILGLVMLASGLMTGD